jgi:cytochrome d ubiquinol oxidase subunit I
MTDDALWHRIQFAFTITYHYLFPHLTMGLALILKCHGLADRR